MIVLRKYGGGGVVKNAVINLRCDKAFKERLQGLASKYNTSISALIIGLTNKAIDDIERKQFFRNAFKSMVIDLDDYND